MNATISTPRFRVPPTATTCKHCGTPTSGEDFCCAGCAFVYRLVHEAGFDAYYQIKDTVTAPADAALQPARDFAWLRAAQQEAETRAAASSRTPELVLNIQGISCAGCVWLIEHVFARQPGSGRIEVNAQTGQARLQWARGEFDAAAFGAELQRFNYLVGPASANIPVVSESQALAKRVGLCAAFAMNVMLFTLPVYFGMEQSFAYAGLFGTLSMAFGTLSLLAGGGYFLVRAWHALRARLLHIDLPIALGIAGSYLGSMYGWFTGQESFVYFDFVSSFILLMLVGRWAQTVAVERNQRRLLAQQPAPASVRVTDNSGATVALTPEQLMPEQRFALGAGEMVPVESWLGADEAAFSLAWINGEAEPRTFRRGQRVPAGAQNISRNDVHLVAQQTWTESLLAQLLAPVERGRYRHRLIERIIQAYLIGILGTALLAGIGWAWFSGGDFGRTGAVVVAILVVSCPCALGLALPLADEIAAVNLRRRGVFVRREDLWPRLARIRRLVFDKTGTLTLENPVLENPAALRSLSADARAALAALVADTPHPICRTLHEQLLALGGAAPMPGTVTEHVGRGVELGAWRLGRADWAADEHGSIDTVLGCDGAVIARFTFRDAPRADVAEELAALRARGLDAFILSGDHREKVDALAAQLGIAPENVVAGCSPQEKAAWLDRHGSDRAMMLGDGANDSLAFDRALVRGTPVVHRGLLEQKADFYYLGRGIAGIRALFEINDARVRSHRVLLAFMVLYNVVAVGLSVAGMMNPLLAAILMPVSSLITLALVGWGMRSAWGR